MSHKIFDNNLVAISKNKATLTLKKLVYIRICMSELRKVFIVRIPLWLHQNKYGNEAEDFYSQSLTV